MIDENVLELIKLSLWGKGKPRIDISTFEEMNRQAISALPASVISMEERGY